MEKLAKLGFSSLKLNFLTTASSPTVCVTLTDSVLGENASMREQGDECQAETLSITAVNDHACSQNPQNE